MKYKFKPIHLLALLIPIIILLLSYNIIYQTTSYTQDQQDIINYLDKNTQISQESKATLEVKEITEDELSHLDDVKTLTNTLNIILIIALLTITIYTKSTKNIEPLALGSILTLATLIIILITTTLNFNQGFEIFHKLLFPQGNYQFPADSTLISALPAQFFQTFAIKIGILSLITTSSIIFFTKNTLKDLFFRS